MPRCSFSSFSSGAVSNSGLIPSTWLSAFFYSWFLFFSFSLPISLVFHFLSFSARTAFYFNHLREWSGHNELGILYGLHGGIKCGKKWYWGPLKQCPEPLPVGTGQLAGSVVQPRGGNLWLFCNCFWSIKQARAHLTTPLQWGWGIFSGRET